MIQKMQVYMDVFGRSGLYKNRAYCFKHR